MPESAEEYYARIQAATDAEGRLPVAVEEMPGWFVFPYQVDSLRIKPLEPMADEEEARSGEDPATCWCAGGVPERTKSWVWSNERWKLTLSEETGVPLQLTLSPLAHHDLGDLPDELAAEMGRLVVAVSAAMEALPSVGRTHVYKVGDGGAHLHLFFFARPARIPQFRGSPLLDWEENLPRVPLEVLRDNATYVGERLVTALGGDGPAWL